MKKIIAIALFAVIILLPAAAKSAAYGNAEYEISSYNVDIIVGSDNVYEITETIVADFFVPKHGIFREIPMRYEGQSVQITDISVNDKYAKSKSNGNLVLKIGDPEITLTGKKEYIIKYTFNMGKDSKEGFDLFYFNIIGTGWDTSISNIKFSITFPMFFEKNDVSFYTGKYGGSTARDVNYEVAGLKINGTVPVLYAGEGLTAYVKLPESAFAGETGNDNSIFFSMGAWCLCGLLILLALYIWNSKGRDPSLYPAVQFEPPDGMTPAEVGYVIDGIVDNRDITSLIFYWADKGYLDITESGKNEFLFIKKKEPVTSNYFETYMFSRLFSYGKDGWVSTNDLKQEFYEDIPIIKTQIKEKFEKNTKLFTKESKVWSGFLHLISVIPSIILLFVIMGGLPPFEVIIPSVFMFAGILFSGAVAIQTMKKWKIFTRAGRIARIILFALFIVIMTAAFFVFAFAMEEGYSVYYHSPGFIIAEAFRTALTTFVIFAFSAATIKRTEYGHNKLEHLLGLKNFINEAEMDKLKKMIDDNPSYFYNILPYAIVLGLEKKWAGKMDGITMPPPEYYRTASGMRVSPALATGRLLSCVARTGIVMSMGRSSGSGVSGGGFSGGGAGGGGGGSW
jgi:uncharacterized membrane protein YgcG